MRLSSLSGSVVGMLLSDGARCWEKERFNPRKLLCMEERVRAILLRMDTWSYQMVQIDSCSCS